jgi:starch phosphorylase
MTAPLAAYVSMELALESAVPTYAGGLGVLAGDAVRAAADLGVPLVAVTLVHRKGYFRQHLAVDGAQTETPAEWSPEDALEPLPQRASLRLEGRVVQVRAWRRTVSGVGGATIPVYLLDTALPENAPDDRAITDTLYGGDERYRLKQEAVLGLGGVAVLRALHPEAPHTYHMNEGHAALLTLALLAEEATGGDLRTVGDAERERVRERCVFTTHTPVPAGHDRFPTALVREVLGDELARAIEASGVTSDGVLNMTALALFFSRYVNGVALRHGEVAASMFPRYPMNAITNGVHATTWTSTAMAAVHDRHIPQWRRDNRYLRYVIKCPLEEIRDAHASAKAALLEQVARRTARSLDPAAFIIGFARRATAYKRADLIFADLERLRAITRDAGPVAIVYAGKAHPRDEAGKELIRRVLAAGTALGADLPVVYLEDYDMALAKVLCAGVDLWLNTPRKPLEASGTSGMKAALNGVPSLSVLDGWWVEGHIEGVTGWSIGDASSDSDDALEAGSLYDKLERVILPLFHRQPLGYAEVMRAAIAHNGSFFNAQRMVSQYVENAYLAPAAGRG